MFLLIPPLKIPQVLFHCSLHSTMFLLILCVLAKRRRGRLPLHSTMFLLIRGFGDVRKCSVRHFTFHDVSINTHHTASDRGYIPVFTFHDVSINTSGKRSWTSFLFPLHSTMFLLILVSCFSSCALSRTLHSTMFLLIPPPRTDIVNTLSPLHSTMFLLIPLLKCQAFRSVFLYIPRCFY